MMRTKNYNIALNAKTINYCKYKHIKQLLLKSNNTIYNIVTMSNANNNVEYRL